MTILSFQSENTTIWQGIDSKLNITDQRYNDTIMIDAVNSSIVGQCSMYNDTILVSDINTTLWNELNLKMYITDQRYNDTQMLRDLNTTILSLINSTNSSSNAYTDAQILIEKTSRVDNDTLLQNNINSLNNSLISNVSVLTASINNETKSRIDNDTMLNSDLGTAINNNVTTLNNALSNAINNNNTQLQNNINALNQSMLNNISTLNTNLGTAITNNISSVNNALVNNITTLNASLSNYISGVNSTLTNAVNGKATLIGDNVFVGNNYFLGNVTVGNGILANASAGLLVQIGSTVYFNVTLGDVFIKDSLRVTGDITANNFKGNINASYIQNPYWLIATDQRYNETSLILNINTSLWGNLSATNNAITNNISTLNTNLGTAINNNATQLQNNINSVNQSRIGNETLLQTNIDAINLSLINNVSLINSNLTAIWRNLSRIDTNLTSVWSNMSKYIANFTDAKLNNVTINKLYINSTTSWMYFDTTTNTTYLRYLNGNLSFWDASDPVLVLDQSDNVVAKHNVIVEENITSRGWIFSKEQDISSDLNFGTHSTYPNSPLTVSGNVNSYLQAVFQNRNSSNLSSMDIVIGSDLMTDATNYLDLGYNSNAYNDPIYSVTDKNSGYLINWATGNLSIGTALSSGLRFFTNGTTIDKVRMYIDNLGKVGINTQTPTTYLQVNGNASIKNTTGGNSASVQYIGGLMICYNSTNSTIITSRTGVGCN
jgi:hypothetical protein